MTKLIITDKEILKQYAPENRLWQGIPSIEVTKGGRIFVTFYSGSVGERIGNYCLVLVSDDGGKTFSEPVCASYYEDHRCFDPCLWIDPLGRLWFTWSIMPDDYLYASICAQPDADELIWSNPFPVGEDIMMNKPTVLSTGEWLFPIAIWKRNMRGVYQFPPIDDDTKIPGAYSYKTTDNGKTFERLGGADVDKRDFDEHVILELSDGRLATYVRTSYGVGVSYSYDRGKTWTKGEDSGFGGAESRFQITRLKSGRLLMINHKDTKKRTNLAAMLSDDEGKTWKYSLMLDDREWVSYPDCTEADDGFIYVTYDRERGGSSLETTYSKAREILIARFTENEIMDGKISNEKSYLRRIVSKLGKYAHEEENPYGEPDRYSYEELAEVLLKNNKDNILGKLFEYYPTNCVNLQKLDSEKLDTLIDSINKSESNLEILTQIISLVRSVSDECVDAPPLVNRVKEFLLKYPNEDITVKDIAKKIGVSYHYMLHQFKKITGTTVTAYRNELKLSQAKRMLVQTTNSLSDIAHKCGFASSSYFSKMFMEAEKMSPSDYRKLNKAN